MINSPIKILDNSGCSFTSENGQIILGQPINGFRSIGYADIGSTISYLCKNKDSYEVGIGKVIDTGSKIALDRIRILQSSNNNQPVNFGKNNSNTVYSFANSYNFKTAFNNFVSRSNDFPIDAVNATYHVDISKKDISSFLPSVIDNQGLCLEFKTTNGLKYLYIKDSYGKIVLTLSGNRYSKLICTGEDWVELKDESLSFGSQNFTTLAYEAALPDRSFQYSNSGLLTGANFYVGLNNKLLLGSSTEANAYAILPTTGTYNTVFNNLGRSSDFIVKGSGDKSLWFLNTGKVGINVPITAAPESLSTLHIVNTVCGEGIKLENRNQCSPSNITLYNKPQQLPDAGATIGTINLSAKNSINSQIEFSQIIARALSSTASATSGEFAIAVNRANTQVEVLTANHQQTNIIAGSNRIRVSNTGIDLIGNVNISSLKWTLPSSSGQILTSDGSGNLVLTNPSNASIISLLDGEVVVFTGVCS